jgi:hypothetical protein
MAGHRFFRLSEYGMKYMCLIYGDSMWHERPEAEKAAAVREYLRFTDDIKKSGHYVAGDPLQPAHTARRLSVRSGKVESTDGPFAETKEQLGGYYIVEAQNMDEAAAIAVRIPGAKIGYIEVRPILTIPSA